MRIFLTGATGHIGSAVLDSLVCAGHEVRALVRGTDKAEWVAACGGHPITGDLSDPETYREAGAGLDGYIHTALDRSVRGTEVDRAALEGLIELARGPRRAFLMYTSAVWVLGSTQGPAAEDAPLNPAPPVVWRPAHEELVLKARKLGLRPVIVRPGLVYGGTRGLVVDIIRAAGNGLIRVVGSGENHWPLVYVRDLGDLYARLAMHKNPTGIYHANDEGDERVNDLVDAIAAIAPRPPDVRHVPLAEARTKLGGYADALALDQIVRSPRARALGWSPMLKSVARNAPRLLEEWRAGNAA